MKKKMHSKREEINRQTSIKERNQERGRKKGKKSDNE